MDPRILIMPVGVPTVVVLVGLWLLWRRADRVDSRGRAIATATLAPVVFAATWALGQGLAALPPGEAFGWAPWAVIVAGLVGVLGAAGRENLAASIMRVLLVAVPAVMLRAQIQNDATRTQALLWILGAGALGIGAFTAVRYAARERGPAVPILFVVSLACGAAAMALTGNLIPPVLMAAMCALAGPGFIIGLLRPWYNPGWSIAAPVTGAAAMGFFTSRFGDTPIACNALLALSLIAIPLSAARPFARLSGWRRWLVRVVLVAAPGLAAVGVALANQPPEYGEDEAYTSAAR